MALITVYATKDASALENNDGWSGWDNHHPVGSSASGNKYCSFIYMPLSFSGWTGVTSATLWVRGHRAASGNHVYGDSSGNSRTLTVRRMVSDWGEGTDRGETLWSSQESWGWENRRYGSATIEGGGSRVFTGYSEGTWYEIDVTHAVQQWFAGSANYGFLLTFASSAEESSSGDALEFYSRHAGSGYKPYLQVTYSDNTAPLAPTGLTPTADALINSLAPTLTGTQNDPDGDSIHSVNMLVYEDNGTTLKWETSYTQPRGSVTFSRPYGGAALTGNTFYKWKARTNDGALWGPFSALQRFKVNTPPNPPALAITESPNNDLNTLNPTLNITHSDNDVTDNKMFGYRAIVERVTSPASVVWDSGDIDTTASPSSTKSIPYAGPSLSWGVAYRWRAATKDANAVWGSLSGWQDFATHATLPPVGLAPDGETISNLTPTFSGSRASSQDTITSYTIEVYASDYQTLIWDSGTQTSGITSAATFTRAYGGTALALGTTYVWRARVTSNGVLSGYSSWATFTTPADTSVPSLSMPTTNNGTRVTTLTPTLPATRATAFTNYQIELYPSTATSTALGSPIWDSGNISQTSATSFARVYSGSALSWNTTYKWRARVGSPTLGGYTGLSTFTTDTALTPTLTLPAANDWTTTLTPTFTGSSGGAESMTSVRIRVFNANGSTLIWDSGMVAQGASTTFSMVYSGPALAAGYNYLWDAQYTKSTGPTGPVSGQRMFHPNAAPQIPTLLQPSPGRVYSGILLPTFEAFFEDLDRVSMGDTPSSWVIEIRNNSTDALIQTKTLTTGLVSGLNSYTWGTNTGGADTGLAYNTVYKWRTWFVDSKSATGTASSYNTFSSAQPPTYSISTPSNGSNVNTTRPIVTWTYSDPSSSPQLKFIVRVLRNSTGTTVYNSTEVISPVASFQVPTGYLTANGEGYTIVLQVANSLGLYGSEATSSIQLLLNAPPRIEGLSSTVLEEDSRILLDWDKSSLGAAFVTYVVYRRDVDETEWTMIGTRKPETNVTFADFYAGQKRTYEYRVTVVKLISSEPDLESPDSDIVTAKLESDTWFVVGADRSDGHIFELPVSDESHTRPVQQETFEPLGTNRKAVVRGFVLGHEGTIDVMWYEEEAYDAKQKVEYLLYYAGPHILKNPFGDVYDVTFGSPDYKYENGGHLSATLTWVEVGATNNPGLTPDQYLAQIGAQ